MKKIILLIEPFYKGSHKYWADKLKELSRHNIELATRNGVFWKWKFMESELLNRLAPDHGHNIILGSNMLNLAPWAGQNRKVLKDTKLVTYFHENQLTYPDQGQGNQKSEKQKDAFFGFHNISTAICADKTIFNSEFHKQDFIAAIKKFSKKIPDKVPDEDIEFIKDNSSVLGVGIETDKFLGRKTEGQNQKPLILWNHRWEFDKNPDDFFAALNTLSKEGLEFDLGMLGHAPKKLPDVFTNAQTELKKHIVQWGSVESFDEYASWLWRADILPVTSNHDFFGISVLEAALCETILLLPKRNAYPDHFPVDKFKNLYYESQEDFVSKLRDLIQIKTENQYLADCQEIAKGFDWENIIKEFDKKMDEL
jgi:glycosyltransferase involved in cell wall biosynthesis